VIRGWFGSVSLVRARVWLGAGHFLGFVSGPIPTCRRVCLAGTPPDVDYILLKADLLSIGGVRSVHSLHMWSLTMDKAAVAVHLAIDTSVDACTVMASASRIIRHKYNVTFTTVQVKQG